MKSTALFLLAIALAAPAFAQDAAEAPPIRALAFSPDGLWLAVGSGEPEEAGEVVVWNLKTEKPEYIHKEKRGIGGVAFSPNSKRLAVAVFGGDCKLLDAKTGKLRGTLEGETPGARAVAFSPDGAVLAVTGEDHAVRLWDWALEKVLHTLTGHSNNVYQPVFSHDGMLLATPSADQTVKLWNVREGKLIKTYDDYTSLVRRAAFGPQSKWLVATCWDLSVKLRDVETGKVLADYGARRTTEGMALSKDGKILALGRYRNVEIHPVVLRPATDDEKKKIEALFVRLDDDDPAIREQAQKDFLKIGRVAAPFLKTAQKESKSAEVRMQSRRLRVAIAEQMPETVLKGHETYVEIVQFSPDGEMLASTGRDGVIMLWDTATWKKIAELRR